MGMVYNRMTWNTIMFTKNSISLRLSQIYLDLTFFARPVAEEHPTAWNCKGIHAWHLAINSAKASSTHSLLGWVQWQNILGNTESCCLPQKPLTPLSISIVNHIQSLTLLRPSTFNGSNSGVLRKERHLWPKASIYRNRPLSTCRCRMFSLVFKGPGPPICDKTYIHWHCKFYWTLTCFNCKPIYSF